MPENQDLTKTYSLAEAMELVRLARAEARGDALMVVIALLTEEQEPAKCEINMPKSDAGVSLGRA